MDDLGEVFTIDQKQGTSKGSLQSFCKGSYTWRFMASYKWGYKSPKMAYKYSYPTYNLRITTHEPPSKGSRLICSA